jgi:hypothetical protein
MGELERDQFTESEFRAMHEISAEDPELGAYYGFPDVQKLILEGRTVEQEPEAEEAPALQRQRLLDRTWYNTPSGLQQRSSFYPNGNDAENQTATGNESDTMSLATEAESGTNGTHPAKVVTGAVRSLRKQEVVAAGSYL